MVYRLSEHVAFRADKPASELIAEYEGTRVAVFSMEPGQVVPAHTSPATVFMLAYSGRGVLRSGEESSEAKPGDLVIVPPNVPHGMAAGDEQFVVLAFIQFPKEG
ncbi:MAG: cupin domain-containing protein [Thermaerobacter sp.]|nr:cupin domain-containing protein [Thermaerobacter sp.]